MGGTGTEPPELLCEAANLRRPAAVTYVSPSNGWAVMVKSTNANNAYWYVARTTNGGKTWVAVSSLSVLQSTSQIRASHL